jgi:hypothetical protein
MRISLDSWFSAHFERLAVITCLLHEGIDTRERLEAERHRLSEELVAKARESRPDAITDRDLSSLPLEASVSRLVGRP